MSVGPVVVKFGGSLLGLPQRDALLRIAARAGAVVVPGGGPFAEAVRTAQSAVGFSDRAAHAMAILGMEQCAHLLRDVAPALAFCDTHGDFAAARARGLGALWRPSAMASASGLPERWDVTSDSLAIWLAAELKADRAILLKSAAVDAAETLEALAARGVVDGFSPALAKARGVAVEIVGPATAAAFEAALARSARRAA